MASTVVRCMVSLGSKGLVSTRKRGAWLGRAGVDPPGRVRGQGLRRRPLILFFLYEFACDLSLD